MSDWKLTTILLPVKASIQWKAHKYSRIICLQCNLLKCHWTLPNKTIIANEYHVSFTTPTEKAAEFWYSEIALPLTRNSPKSNDINKTHMRIPDFNKVLILKPFQNLLIITKSFSNSWLCKTPTTSESNLLMKL